MRTWCRSVSLMTVLVLAAAACSPGGGGSAVPGSEAGTSVPTPVVTPLVTASNGPSATASATAPHGDPSHVLLLYHVPAEFGAATGEIWVIGADGSGRRKIANGVQASWSADGQTIHVVDWHGSCVPSITDYPVGGGPGRPVAASLQAGDSGFSWSPDDTQIVFFRQIEAAVCEGFQFGGNPRAELRSMSAQGEYPRQLVASVPSPGLIWWAPDGMSFVYDDRPVDETGPLKLVTYRDGAVESTSPSSQSRSALQISPDFSKIAYIGGAADPKLHLKADSLFGRAEVELGSVGDMVMSLLWSPDSSSIALLVDDRVAVVRPPTAGASTAYTGYGYLFEVLAWSADSTRLATTDADGTIVVVGADGAGARTLPGTAGVDFVSWQP
jgi:dipeptidyl aminopeptidase/acylaminoacyl peptidase